MNRLTPVDVMGVTDAVEVTAGQYSACARRTGGTLVCWGHNSHGQLGDGTLTERHSAGAVASVAGATQITCGGEHCCAMLSTGSVKCWGANSNGELGEGTTSDRRTPVPI